MVWSPVVSTSSAALLYPGLGVGGEGPEAGLEERGQVVEDPSTSSTLGRQVEMEEGTAWLYLVTCG